MPNTLAIDNQELAYSYWKIQAYEQVIEELTNYEIPAYITHPLDRAAGIEISASRAYCYEKTGNRELAVNEIISCYQQISAYPDSTYKASVTSIYRELLNL